MEEFKQYKAAGIVSELDSLKDGIRGMLFSHQHMLTSSKSLLLGYVQMFVVNKKSTYGR